MRIGVYYSRLNEISGGSRLAVEVADALEKLGYQGYILTNNYDIKALKSFSKLGKKEIIHVPLIGGECFSRPVSNMLSVGRYLSKIKELSLDIVVYIGSYYLSPVLQNVCKVKSILYVFFPYSFVYDYTFREIFDIWSWKRTLIRNIERKIYQSSDLILCISNFVKVVLKIYFDVEAKLLYEPIDTDFFIPDFSKKSENVILTLARFTPGKRLDTMISLFQKLKGRYVFIIAGGPVKGFEYYYRKIKRLASYDNRIIFEINPTDEKLRELLQKAAVFWYMREEHHAWIPLEAMACGTPVVIINQPGLNGGIIHGVNGMVANDEREFLEYTRYLLEHNEKRLKMGERAREYVKKNFSTEMFRQKLKKYIMECFSSENSASL